METKKIAIVGAGISGLLACKYTLSKGLHPIVFESEAGIGGVWTKTVETTKLQTPKPTYQFSDFPWPDSVAEDFPDTQQVLGYIKSYAHHFDLPKHIKFGTRVLSIRYEGPPGEAMQSWSLWGGDGRPFSSDGKWKIRVQDCLSLETELWTYQAAKEFVSGKTVVVVGLQKSALDIAMECSAVNGVERPCTVLYKTEHWNVPDYLPWGVPLALLYLTRFSELLVHKPREGLLLSLMATLLTPLRWAISKFVESHIKRKLRLKKFGMVPKHSFLQEISSCLISTVPEKFYDRVEEGSIILKKAPAFGFCKNGISIDGEVEPLNSDLVILATGFRGEKKLLDLFESQLFQDCLSGSPNSIVPLYRACIHPRIPQLAVIGFSESAANLYTSEIRCRWLAELLAGTFKLPSEMEEDIEEWDKYMKRSSGPYYRRSCIAALHIWYNDQLCRDMGWNPKRKKGFFAELFEPYGPTDYVSP
ncbi:hypothetical protein EUGRSUZ_G01840 [Eucalyptus grandis]|uniref:Flavin-containing monooxygenase n=2 Tax=Eucalyptus grandis TaxID=71139 RepID=A0A059BD94_EUCGR|nr:hypothetical protein EUGRSUZ_G01840 [Eucalyptus grandis]